MKPLRVISQGFGPEVVYLILELDLFHLPSLGGGAREMRQLRVIKLNLHTIVVATLNALPCFMIQHQVRQLQSGRIKMRSRKDCTTPKILGPPVVVDACFGTRLGCNVWLVRRVMA
jgi:hypothetical protein